jgi:hypothetical protein
MRWPGRRGWLLLAVVAVGVGAGLAVIESPGGQPLPSARARVYLNVDACLLSGPRGVSAASDSAVWAGMEDASLDTRARVLPGGHRPGDGGERTAVPRLAASCAAAR